MSTQPKRSSTGLIVGLVVALVAGAAILFAVVGGRSSKKDVVVATPAVVSTTTTAAGASSSTVAGPSVAAAENQAVVVAGDALADLPDGGKDPAIGKKAPTLNGFSFDGSPLSIAPGSGKPMLVVFVAHWCPHCQREVPRLVSWMTSAQARTDLQISAVSTGVAKDRGNYPPSAWLAKEKWTPPVLADSVDRDAAGAYGLTAYPYFVIVKADGTVAFRGSGEITMIDLSAKLDEVLGKAA